MSVEYEMPTSTFVPAEMAFCSLSSSWPECTSTLTPGLAFSKSSTTDWMTLASRSLKKCQSETVPSSLRGAVLAIGVGSAAAAARGEQGGGGDERGGDGDPPSGECDSRWCPFSVRC